MTSLCWPGWGLCLNLNKKMLTMQMSQMPLTPPSPQRGEGDRLRRYYSLSPWERVGVRACGLV